MTTTPRTGSPELAAAQADPEPTVNEGHRRIEQGAGLYIVEDKDENDPPGTCSDGQAWLVAATATGAWLGKEGKIAFAVGANASNGWLFRDAAEGIFAYVKDEDKLYLRGAASWAEFVGAPAPLALDGLSDVDTSGVSAGYVLMFTGGGWDAVAPLLDDMDDVNAAAPGDGEVLTWDNGAGEWVPAPAPGSGGGSGGTVPNGGATGEVLRKASGVDQDTEWGAAGGLKSAAISTVGTPASTTETDLQTYAMPAGLVSANGQVLRITCGGALGATTRSRNVRLYLGSTVIVQIATTTAAETIWSFEAVITRRGATSQQIQYRLHLGGAASDSWINTRFGTATENFANALTIKVTGQVGGSPVANDIDCRTFIVEHLR